MKQESKFYEMINKVNNGEVVDTDDSLSSKSNEIESPVVDV